VKKLYLLIILSIFTVGLLLPTQESVKIDKNKYKKSIEGLVVDGDGNGVFDATVILIEKNIVVQTSRTGRFVIEFLGGGALHLEISKPGFLPHATEFFSPGKKVHLKLPRITLLTSPLEEVVVTGTATPKLYREAPVKTAVATKKTIEKKGAQNLADSLELFTGVRVENNCQNCNFTQVRLNGMEGKYTQILLNGLPVFSALAGVYGLEQIPAEMVEKIEVVKGGGSALYGGSAVAGVVNVMLKEPVHSGTVLSLQQGVIYQDTPDTLFNIHNDYVSKDLNSRASSFARYQRRDPMDYNDDGFSDMGELTSLAIGTNFSHFFPKINGKLNLNADVIYEDRRGGNLFDFPPHFADIAEAIRTHRIDAGIGWEQVFGKTAVLKLNQAFSYTKRNSYYGADQDPNAYGLTKNPVHYVDLTYNHIAFKRHDLLAGVSFRSDKLQDSAPAYDRYIDDIYTNWGFFVQDEMTVAKNVLNLLAGIRIDKHSEIGTVIPSPRLSLIFKGIKNLALRATYSTGFRAPQIFDEDLHITQTGGEGMLIVNSGDLKEERSNGFSAGLDFGRQSNGRVFSFSLGGFYTRLTDTFTLREIASTDNARVFERFNGAGAKVYGLEVEAGLIIAGVLDLSTGWTFQRSRYDEPEPDFDSEDFFRTPEVYGFVRLDWELTRTIDIIADCSYTGSMKVPHYAGAIEADRLETSDPFFVIDLSVTKEIGFINGSRMTLTLTVLNVLDEYQQDLDRGMYRDAGYVYGPRLPRTFRIGLKYRF